MKNESILIFGCGNMAGAMLDGWLAGGLDPARFTVVDRSNESAPEGVTLLREVPEDHFDAVLIGIKPHMLADIAPLLEPLAGPDTAMLSILAGTQLDVLRKTFPRAGSVVRVMPNLAVALGKSPIALAAQGLDEAGRAALSALLEPLGTPEWIAEDAFDLVTALAGSGPGFVYRFIDALAAGAHSLGLPHDQSQRLATAMVEGAAALAAASPHSPGELARRVASPGGVTQKGLDVLDDGKALERLMEATLRAARDRSAEMARQARGEG